MQALNLLQRLIKLLKSKVALLLIAGLIIRFSIAPFTEHRYDMYIWRLNQVLAYEYHVNPLNPLTEIDKNATIFYWSYPPLWLFCLLAVYPLYAMIVNPTYPIHVSSLWQAMYTTHNPCEAYRSFIPKNLPLLDFLIKFPLALSDVTIGLLLFKTIKKFSGKNRAYEYTRLWILNPYVIFISAVWGMFDSLPALFTMVAIYFFLQEKYDKSAISLALGALFKMYPILFAPILSLICCKKSKRVTSALKYLLISFGLTLLVLFLANFSFALIFGNHEPLNTSIVLIWQLFKGRASPDWYGSNIFFGLTPLGALDILFRFLNVETNIPISPILIGFAAMVLLFKIVRRKDFDSKETFSYVTIAHFIIYLTYSVVNEQYLIWILPFLLVLSAIMEDIRIKFVYWIMSLLPLLFIFFHYSDLSYFLSPYYFPSYLGYSTWVPAFGITATIMYLIGIIVISKRNEGRVRFAQTF